MTAAVAEGSDDGVPSPEDLDAALAAEVPIKPCPFCGGPGRFVDAGRFLAFVKCANARCWTLGPSSGDRDSAIEAWNRRSP